MTASGPLSGIRVVEFDAIGPIPLCAMLLADMGADIVRIARAGGQAAYEDIGASILHRGRTGVDLNLKAAEDKDVALRLIEKADILLEGFRPGVMERLGLGPEICLERAPALVYGRMTGWGQQGELAQRAGHDINYIAISGALAAIGEKGRPPVPPLNIVGDYAGGSMFLAMGVLAALSEARRSGRGQVVDAAMIDSVPLLMSLFLALSQNGGWDWTRGANLLDGGAPYYRCYECADGGYVAVGALEPQFYAQLLEGLGLEAADFPQGPKSLWNDTQRAFARCFLTRTRDEWGALFAAKDACVSPVLTMTEAQQYPHNRTRANFVEHGGIVHPAPAPRFARTPGEIRSALIDTAANVLERWSAAVP